MKKNGYKLVCLLVLIVLFVNCRAFSAIQYTITDLGSLGGGSSFAYGINESGQITGVSATATGDSHAFLYSNGSMISLGTLGGSSSVGYGINENGHVTGEAQIASGKSHVFLYVNGSMADLDFEGVGRGINNSGQITGKATNAVDGFYGTFIYDIEVHGGTIISDSGFGYGINDSGQAAGWDGLDGSFLYSNGEVVGLGIGAGYGINNVGQIAGESFINDVDLTASLYSDGKMIHLGTLGGSSSAGYGINENGQVTGYAETADGYWHAFLYSNSIMTDLNVMIDPASGWTLISGRDINDLGQICGYGINPQGYEHAFLLTPIPEPCSVLLFGVGVVFLRRRRQGFSID